MLTRRLGLWIAAASLSLLGGCASTLEQQSAADPIDNYKMAAIERAAASNGVRVYWVNYPLKKIADKPAS